ncbi:uncharacterized protein LOC125503953 [Dendroctonus ponderosae]|uniref:uncharacterized protein LOC125503953 n=1 Tax=Dendroctonus ponderosae TaxID=77166 RepID=UPI002035E481|nr:uncharacterized protein LOC125503953 [Dendroctonus ponderosae]
MAVNYLNSVAYLIRRESYEDLCFAMENVFVLEGLTKCVDGSETDTVLIAKAKAKLVLIIDPSLYGHVKEAKTCKEVWEKVKSLYEDTGFTRTIGLLRSLISLRLDNCQSMENYVNQVIESAQRLRRTGFKMDDEWVGSLLLAGMPDKYSPMIMAIEHSGIDISADSIKSKLLDRAADDSDGTRTGAFAAKHDSLQKQFKGDNASNDERKTNDRSHDCRNVNKHWNKRKVICYKCKKPVLCS